ncbi:hypothetical protein LOK49_LG08G00343 [Camellia lanceoleosa]|uniref:Uncharacterized protein n=1 Tax=Camellia lanceoleosa TaxID=1840588 RepID=A0ACC0GMJ9_9ERIC|nr:hypothetical protein LOK49_LG08G00343 [Camellia lanceoleosa]
MIGGIPSFHIQPIFDFLPVTIKTITGLEKSDSTITVVETASLNQTAVRGERAGGAPDVGEDGERAEGVGDDVVFDGMGSAVGFQNDVVGVESAFVVGERDVGGAEVGAVEDYDTVVGEELHVHGSYANVVFEEGPPASSGGGVGQIPAQWSS